MAVRVALAEAALVAETAQFLAAEGVDVGALEAGMAGAGAESSGAGGRSDTVILVKNLPPDAGAGALRDLIQRRWHRSILTLDVTALWLLGASDDLVLDAAVEDVIALA